MDGEEQGRRWMARSRRIRVWQTATRGTNRRWRIELAPGVTGPTTAHQPQAGKMKVKSVRFVDMLK